MKHPHTIRNGLRPFVVATLLLLPVSPLPAQTAPASPAASNSASSGSGEKDAAVQLSVFTVSEDKEVGYESIHTTSGMRTVQELKNVASSISIMNSQLIEDLAVIDIGEMSKWFVTGEESPDPAQFNQLIFRGIRNSFALRNGWIWYSPMDAYATERVELLRGPNAFLYGEADLGGANNQVTKRGLFTRSINRAKLMVGSENLIRGEIDFNRRLGDKLAVRLAAVASSNDSWMRHAGRKFHGVYGAVTYRPFRQTMIHATADASRSRTVVAQGLFLDQFTYTTGANLTNTAGVVFIPKTGAMYRAAGTRRSAGSGTTVVNPKVVPRDFQVSGPESFNTDFYDTFNLEVEQHVGKNLHLLLSGVLYFRNTNTRTIAAARTIYRDLSPTLPGGAPNPNFNELYTEYFRLHNRHGNTLRAFRFSAVYDLNTKWMKQQFIANAQQQQDNPKHWGQGWGEYVLPNHPNFVGAVNHEQTLAAFLANRTTFTSNRFIRRYYLRDGNDAGIVGDTRPIPGVSGYFPDLSNGVAATGEQLNRRFYTPSFGVGASGSYFNNHFFTLLGYRRDHFNMKTTFGAPRPLENSWIVDYLPELNRYTGPNSLPFAQYKVDGTNMGLVFRLNDRFALAYNRAQSFRISAGDGNPAYIVGRRQGMQTGEGDDISARLSLFGGRLEFNTTYYHNFQPNARFNPAPPIAVRDELSALFPTEFNSTGQDLQTTTTKGYEVEIVANLTRQWRVMLNGATNKVLTEDRVPMLKGFQAAAKSRGDATPLLDAFLLTIPEGVPNAGYTKLRANFFTRYTFSQGRLKGLFIGGGTNYRTETYRGNAVVVQGGPILSLWSPSYYLVTLLGGYQTRILNRPTSIQLNLSNLLDKDYFLSATTTTGSWGAPRSWRLTVITDF